MPGKRKLPPNFHPTRKRPRSSDLPLNSPPSPSTLAARLTTTLTTLYTKHTKHLSRALKLARGHESQKLARRIKTAREKNETATEKRCEVELEVTKHGISNVGVAEEKLKKVFGGVRGWREAMEGVELKGVGDGEGVKELGDEERKAVGNVKGRLLKAKNVMQCVGEAVAEVERALGVRNEGLVEKKRKAEEEEKEEVGKKMKDLRVDDGEDLKGFGEVDGEEGGEEARPEGEEKEDPWDYLDDPEVFGEFNQRLAASSSEDEASEDDDTAPNELNRTDDEWSGGESDIEVSDDEDEEVPEPEAPPAKKQKKSEPEPEPKPKKAKEKKTEAPITGSKFLPTLMGGYVSGSDSDPDADFYNNPKAKKGPPEKKVRKNRMGQQARRALWEKKFGEKAKHVQKSKEDQRKEWLEKKQRQDQKQKEWEEREAKRKERGVLGRGGIDAAAKAGELHPSWEAARKKKEKDAMMAAALSKPQGKKITFD